MSVPIGSWTGAAATDRVVVVLIKDVTLRLSSIRACLLQLVDLRAPRRRVVVEGLHVGRVLVALQLVDGKLRRRRRGRELRSRRPLHLAEPEEDLVRVVRVVADPRTDHRVTRDADRAAEGRSDGVERGSRKLRPGIRRRPLRIAGVRAVDQDGIGDRRDRLVVRRSPRRARRAGTASRSPVRRSPRMPRRRTPRASPPDRHAQSSAYD